MRYYIAYGSNLHVEQMRMRCPGAVPLGTGYLNSYGLLFRGSMSGAYLTIEPRAGYRVPVAVYSVTASDERALDRYEGYPAFYYKKTMRVTYTGIVSGREKTVDAFVYIMHENRPRGVPSQGYVRTCRTGYREWALDPAPLVRAVEEALDKQKKGA